MMSKLSLRPQKIDDHNWYYEEKAHICLIHEVVDEYNNIIRTDKIKIPWKKLRKSLHRLEQGRP